MSTRRNMKLFVLIIQLIFCSCQNGVHRIQDFSNYSFGQNGQKPRDNRGDISSNSPDPQREGRIQDTSIDSLVLYATYYNRLYKAPPPADEYDRWSSRAKIVNVEGWTNFPSVMVDPEGYLYKANENGQLYRDNEPLSWNSVIESYPPMIGLNGWEYFKFLMINPSNRLLYAVTKMGQLYKATLPKDKYDNWIGRAELISRDSNWNEYRLLTFDNRGELFGVHSNGQFYRGLPPSSKNEESRMRSVSSEDWSHAKKIFFDPNSILYVVTITGGHLYKGWPPQYGQSNWFASPAKLLDRYHNWAMYDQIFFNPRPQSVPYFFRSKYLK